MNKVSNRDSRKQDATAISEHRRSIDEKPSRQIVDRIATIIIPGFDQHLRIFNEHTRRVAAHVENAQWDKIQLVSKSRIQAYDKRVAETCAVLSELLARDSSLRDEVLWRRVRTDYAGKLKAHLQPKLAESFYNSVFVVCTIAVTITTIISSCALRSLSRMCE